MKIAISHWPLAISKKRGFTVLELTIAIAILAILSLIIATIIIRSGIIFEKQQGNVETGLANRFVLDEISQNVRAAKQVEESFISGPDNYTTGTATLILKIPAINAAGETISGVFDRVVFYKDSEKIIKKVYPDSQSTRKQISQILTITTRTLNFSYNNADVTAASAVTVDLTTVKKLPSGERVNSDKIEVVLRNY